MESETKEKLEVLEQTADYIDGTAITGIMAVGLCEKIGIDKLASPAINFRDAIHHYILMKDALDANQDKKYWSQHASIEEHLSRAIKDLFVHLLSGVHKKIEPLMTSAGIDTEKSNKLRVHYHKAKNLILKMRIGKIDINRNSATNISDDVKIMILELVKDLRELSLLEVFKRKTT